MVIHIVLSFLLNVFRIVPKEFTLGCFLSAHEGACLHIGKSQPREPSGGVKNPKKPEKKRKKPWQKMALQKNMCPKYHK